MRTWLGWALAVLGVVLALAGSAVMVVLGPDNRLSTGPHAIETDDIAVVTAPKVVRWADVKVDVKAEVPARKPVFIGVGNAVDVQDYLAKTQRLEITSFSRPWKLTTRDVEGMPNLPGAPTALDWWIATSEPRLGGATVSVQLPDETVSIAILSVGSSNLSGLQVTLAYGVNRGFTKGASATLLGLAAVWLGVLVVRSGRDDDAFDEEDLDDLDGDEVEEVVYVYVDEDGVEHEISAEEAAELEVVEEVVETGDPAPGAVAGGGADVGGADAEPAEPLPTVPQVVVPGVLTAADIVSGRDQPEPKQEPKSVPEPRPGPQAADEDERVVYVYVDDDGIEHEVSEAELAEFEVVDEDDEADEADEADETGTTDDGKGRA
jgi:hypothetical protein